MLTREKSLPSLNQILTSVLELIAPTLAEQAAITPKSQKKLRTPSRKKVE